MNEAMHIRTHWKTAAVMLLAMPDSLVVASMLQPVATTSAGGPRLAEDPYNDRHAAVVARYHQDSPR